MADTALCSFASYAFVIMTFCWCCFGFYLCCYSYCYSPSFAQNHANTKRKLHKSDIIRAGLFRTRPTSIYHSGSDKSFAGFGPYSQNTETIFQCCNWSYVQRPKKVQDNQKSDQNEFDGVCRSEKLKLNDKSVVLELMWWRD